MRVPEFDVPDPSFQDSFRKSPSKEIEADEPQALELRDRKEVMKAFGIDTSGMENSDDFDDNTEKSGQINENPSSDKET